MTDASSADTWTLLGYHHQVLALMASRFTLPPELEREILETAALRYPEMIPPLLRICRRAQIWRVPAECRKMENWTF
jgi:hypothetical protein